jgi:ABC-type transporter Mla MlaB component
MTIKNSRRRDRDSKALQLPSAELQAAANPKPIVIDVARAGDWMPVEDLRQAALAALAAGAEVTVNLDGIEHLDASSLQILLALEAGQRGLGRHLQLTKASSHLQQWFQYAGATDQFSMSEPKRDE